MKLDDLLLYMAYFMVGVGVIFLTVLIIVAALMGAAQLGY